MSTAEQLLLVVAAVLVVAGTGVPSAARAAHGARVPVAAVGVALAAVVAVVERARSVAPPWGAWVVLAAGAGVGAASAVLALRRRLLGGPRLLALLSAASGAAAALAVGLALSSGLAAVAAEVRVPAVLDVVAACVSVGVAALVSGVAVPRALGPGVLLGVVAVVLVVVLALGHGGLPLLGLLAVVSVGAAGLSAPRRGPDLLPLVIGAAGAAVALAGLALDDVVLVAAGGLVAAAASSLPLRSDSPDDRLDDAALALARAASVVVVPGFGLAASRAHHDLAALGRVLALGGADVRVLLHPVAGRLPGQLNVLLDEAGVPHDRLVDSSRVQDVLARADVALVVGAGDVVNPEARKKGNLLTGLPVLPVEQARRLVVVDDGSGGYSATPNPLHDASSTLLLRGDAGHVLRRLGVAVAAHVR